MKAVVVDIKDSHAAVLSEDGRVYKIKNRNYHISQEIEIKKRIWASTAVRKHKNN